MDKSKISVILSEGWVGPRGAKDLRDDRGSAPGFVRRSFAPTPAPTLSLRMTHGWFWALDNERRNTASPHKHWEFLGSFSRQALNLSEETTGRDGQVQNYCHPQRRVGGSEGSEGFSAMTVKLRRDLCGDPSRPPQPPPSRSG